MTVTWSRRADLTTPDWHALASLLVELALLPILAVLAMVKVVAEADPDSRYGPVRRLVDVLLTGVGVLLIGGGILTLAVEWDQLDKNGLILEALLPVWLTVGLLPFVYAMGLKRQASGRGEFDQGDGIGVGEE